MRDGESESQARDALLLSRPHRLFHGPRVVRPTRRVQHSHKLLNHLLPRRRVRVDHDQVRVQRPFLPTPTLRSKRVQQRLDLLGRLARHRPLQHLAALRCAHSRQPRLDRPDARRAHADLVQPRHAQAHHQRQISHVPRHLAADADPHAVGRRLRHDLVQQSQKRRLARIVQFGHTCVRPVRREHILTEVVGPDADEIHDLRQLIDDHRRRGHLQHDPHGHVRIVRHALLRELPLHPRDPLAEPLRLTHRRHHRGHHLHRSMRRSAADRPQLRTQQVQLPPIQPHPAAAQKRIILLRNRDIRRGLVSANIQRPNDDFSTSPCHRLLL